MKSNDPWRRRDGLVNKLCGWCLAEILVGATQHRAATVSQIFSFPATTRNASFGEKLVCL